MSSHLKFYALEQSPFEAAPQSKTVLGTKAVRDALAAIRSGLQDGSERICVSGQSGLGKTSLARALPKLLSEEARVARPARSIDTLGCIARVHRQTVGDR